MSIWYNAEDDVAPETYEKVQGIIQHLGYTSSLAARSMRSHRTNVIGLIMPDVEFPFAIEVIKGLHTAVIGKPWGAPRPKGFRKTLGVWGHLS